MDGIYRAGCMDGRIDSWMYGRKKEKWMKDEGLVVWTDRLVEGCVDGRKTDEWKMESWIYEWMDGSIDRYTDGKRRDG